jgi:DHA1 family multidrug resistance protein-like MFS transporter
MMKRIFTNILHNVQVFGPVAGGYAAQQTGWRTPLYMLLGLAFFCFVVLFFLFPETSADTILLRRAQRLRKLTGNNQLKSKSEIDQSQLAFSEVLSTALLRPFRLFFEPVVAFIDIYIALVYAVFYLW